MIELLEKQISEGKSPMEKESQLREFLQVLTLKIISDLGYFKNLAFTGGTSLRMLYDLKRFSEDIDFSLIHPIKFQFEKFISRIEKKLTVYGLKVEVKKNYEKTVLMAWIKFPGILHTLKISPLQSQKISIKIEIDTRPPSGWKTQINLINKIFLFTLVSFDLSSLFATKLHACFYRKYTKGRDFYDFLWYIGKGILPNFIVLNNAVMQTTGENPKITRESFLRFLQSGLKNISWKKVKQDIDRFLINKSELQLFDSALILNLVETKYGVKSTPKFH